MNEGPRLVHPDIVYVNRAHATLSNERAVHEDINLCCVLGLASLHSLGHAHPDILLEECLLGTAGATAGVLTDLEMTLS